MFFKRPFLTALFLVTGFTSSFSSVGFAQEEAVGGFSVNRHSRNEVVKFWHRYHQASEGFETRANPTINGLNKIEGTGNFLENDTLRRFNFYRALVGLPANVTLSDAEAVLRNDDAFQPPAQTTRREASRDAAVAMSLNNQPLHEIPESWIAFTPAAYNGARNSLVAVSFWGPDAVDAYMEELGTPKKPLLNSGLGHRRWILHPRLQDIATGDVAPLLLPNGGLDLNSANAIYVTGELNASAPSQFVAWPNDGFFPQDLRSFLWSLSYGGADFTNALVTMTDSSGTNVPLVIRSTTLGDAATGNSNTSETVGGGATGPSDNFGDATIVWEPIGLPEVFTVDTTYHVSISGIAGSAPTTHSYSVTFMSPNSLTTRLSLIGSENPPVDGANYYFGSAEVFDEYDLEISQRGPLTEVEGAEGTPVVLDQTDSSYDLVRDFAFVFGPPFPDDPFFFDTKSFNLAFPNSSAEVQAFEIDRDLQTVAGAEISFSYRRGFMQPGTVLVLEFLEDGASVWTSSGFQVSGMLDGAPDLNFTNVTVSLPQNEGMRVRFRFFTTGGNISTLSSQPTGQPEFPFGIFIDDIGFTSTNFNSSSTMVTLPASSVQAGFNAGALGANLVSGEDYVIRVRPRFLDSPFAWSPAKEVSVIASSPLQGFERWAAFEFPTAQGFDADFDGDSIRNGIEYAFAGSPIDPSDGPVSEMVVPTGPGQLPFLQTELAELADGISYEAEWSQDLDSWSTNGVSVTHSNGQLRATLSGQSGFSFLRWKITD